MKEVAVLFARADSIYKTMPGCDVYDIERDARTWPGGAPVVAHPPCRAWSSMRRFAKPRKGERFLATWAVRQVRANGGVLEHPASSRLWSRVGIPQPGHGTDAHGGWTIGIHQHAFGHRAEKKTILYIVGLAPGDIPELPPLSFSQPTHVVTNVPGVRAWMPNFKPECSKAEREHTPPALAAWLVELARRCAK